MCWQFPERIASADGRDSRLRAVLVIDFDYHLPQECIAQTPLDDRAASRMLVVDRKNRCWHDRDFRDLPEYLREGDRLVLNNTKVLPSRLFGRRAGVHATTSKRRITGLVEVLLLKKITEQPMRWEALVRPGRKLRVGEVIQFPGGLTAKIVKHGARGLRVVEFPGAEDFYKRLAQTGHTPLPPYIKRPDNNEDRERYQTVFAREPGAAAAPTAGLHFTPEILGELRAKGVTPVEITLHVGLGTFQPVRVERVEDHAMHGESFDLPASAADELAHAKRIVAVGTTAVRTLEYVARETAGRWEACSGETDLFIYPGYRFRAVDVILTNFHLPCSTLLMLVCAFGGRELVLDAYAHAVRNGYRFYSYGDCMLLV